MQACERKLDDQAKEIARLQTVSHIGESVARLPAACLTDLNDDKIRDIKQTALHDALMELKGADKGRDDLIAKIEELENRQKKAYLRLYQRVGDEIGISLHKSVQQYEAEMQVKAQKDSKLSASELEMDRLKQGMEGMGYGRVEQPTLDNLFRKYNV